MLNESDTKLVKQLNLRPIESYFTAKHPQDYSVQLNHRLVVSPGATMAAHSGLSTSCDITWPTDNSVIL